MAYQKDKTEHAGAKNGYESFIGKRVDAKKQSSRRRRIADKRACKDDR